MDVVKLWEKVKKTMKRKISEGEFELFFENVKAEKIEDNIFTLTCNSKLIKEMKKMAVNPMQSKKTGRNAVSE